MAPRFLLFDMLREDPGIETMSLSLSAAAVVTQAPLMIEAQSTCCPADHIGY